MKRIVLFAGFCWLTLAAMAQHPLPRTISEVCNLPPGGRKITKAHPLQVLGVLTTDREWPLGPLDTVADRKTGTGMLQKCQPAFQTTSRFTDRYPAPAVPADTLDNGNLLYAEKGRYGLKSADGKVIIPPGFSFVLPDNKNGFVAYQNGRCNYYNANGKPLFPHSYLFIQRTPVNTFIVQTETGFGVINAALKTLVQPAFQHIDTLYGKGEFYYKLTTARFQNYFLHANLHDTVWLEMGFGKPEILNARYWRAEQTLIDVKDKRLIVYPEQLDQHVSIINAAKELAPVRMDDTTMYLINFKGQLLGGQGFYSIMGLPSAAMASVTAAITRNGRREPGTGILNSSGQYVLPPVYSRVKVIDDSLVASSLWPQQLCGRTVFVANTRLSQRLLDQNLQPLSNEYYNIATTKNPAVIQLFTASFTGHLADCQEHALLLHINGQPYDTYNRIFDLGEGFSQVQLGNHINWLLFPDSSAIRDTLGFDHLTYSNNKDFFITASYGGHYGLMNAEGKTIIPPLLESLSPFDLVTGLAEYHLKNGRHGYLTQDGGILFDNRYSRVRALGMGLFAVEQHDLWGVVARDGKVITPITYQIVRRHAGTVEGSKDNASIMDRYDFNGTRL